MHGISRLQRELRGAQLSEVIPECITSFACSQVVGLSFLQVSVQALLLLFYSHVKQDQICLAGKPVKLRLQKPCLAGQLPRPGCTLSEDAKNFRRTSLRALELGLVFSLEFRVLKLLLSVGTPEVLERAYAQEQLKNAKFERADQELERSEAITTKVLRIFTKGAARSRELSSQAKLLQTKFDRLTSKTDLVLLHMTVKEKEQRLH